MKRAIKFSLIISILILVAACKKGDEPGAINAEEYLTCSIDGKTFSGSAVKFNTGDFYTTSSDGSNVLYMVFGDDSHTFFITINNFTKQPGVFSLDRGGYALFKQDDGKAQWKSKPNSSVTVTNFSNNIVEGTFSFTVAGATEKVLTNGKFRSKVIVH